MKPWRSYLEQLILFLLILRPALDGLTDQAFFWISLKFNLAAAVSIILLLLGALWFSSLERERRMGELRRPLIIFLFLWIMLLAFWAVIPVWLHGSSRVIGIREWVRWLSYIPVVMLCSYWARNGEANRILNALLLSFIIPALVGFYQIGFQTGSIIKNVHRIAGTFAHPNPFSFYLVLMIGVTYWKLRWAKNRWGWSGLLGLELILLIATFSFTGAAMFGLLILFCALVEGKVLRYAAIGVLLLFIMGFLATPTGYKRLIDESRMEKLDEVERSGKETTSLIWRLLNWRFLYRTWQKSPWVGYGLASSPRINPMKMATGVGADPHNDYMRYVVETGALGFTAFVVFLISVGVVLTRAAHRSQSPEIRHFMVMVCALYGGWLLGSLNDNLITATAYQYCLWSLFATAAGWSEFNLSPSQPMVSEP